MIKFVKILVFSKVLSVKGLLKLLHSLCVTGLNLNTLAFYSSKMYASQKAIVTNKSSLDYSALQTEIKKCVSYLKRTHQLSKKQKVAIHCRNNAEMAIYLFAAAQLGCDLYLLNTEMTSQQLEKLVVKYNLNTVICDDDSIVKFAIIEAVKIRIPTSSYTLFAVASITKLKPSLGGKLVVLTGGTSGNSKLAARKSTSGSFIHPLYALLNTIRLHTNKSIFIAIPTYHGFGLTALIVSVLLGKEAYFTEKFNLDQTQEIIKKYAIEVLAVVPVQLSRLSQNSQHIEGSLKTIICGGATMSEVLVKESLQHFGPIVYNLYGTSEAGFCIMATPNELSSSASTIGKPIAGVTVVLKQIENDAIITTANSVGKMYIKSSWSVSKNELIETGDLGFFDDSGNYFLKGRTDDMIVSGGENVYPKDVETILEQHPYIREVAVIGISDVEFGQRLKCYVVLHNDKQLTELEIKSWLHDKVARYQMPKEIVMLSELPYTSIGKVNKKALSITL